MNDELTKSIRKQLSPAERIILADLWENPEQRKALTHFLGLRQLQIAQVVLKSSADHYFTVENRGRATELNEFTHFLSSNLKKTNNERAANV
jgi:hypothetical protein